MAGIEAAARQVSAAISPTRGAWLLALFTAALFLPGLGFMGAEVFDEHHYVKAARFLLAFEQNSNPEHPLFAKEAIAASIALFGDNPWAWRLPGVLMGVVTVLSIYAIALTLIRSLSAALLAGALTALNQLVFVQARIAMLDAYMAAFLLAAIALVLRARESPRSALLLSAAGVCLGLSVASKWASAPYVAALLFMFAAVRFREAWGRPNWLRAFAIGADYQSWRNVSSIGAMLRLGGLSVIVYMLTFWPMLFLEAGRLTPLGVIDFQFVMLGKQLAPLGDHPHISPWWEWPLPVNPQWYGFQDVDGGRRAVFLIGNPVIMWSGLLAVLVCLVEGVRRRAWPLLVIAGGFLFAYGLWIVIPKKIAFYYYYYAPGILLSLAIAAAFHLALKDRASITRLAVYGAFLAATAAMFAYFYPVLSGALIPGGDAWLRWVWFRSWA